MITIDEVYPIGIGTYKLDLERKQEILDGLLYSYNNGQNYLGTSLSYDDGKVVEFLFEFFKNVDRRRVFVSAHLERYIEKREDVEIQLDKYLKLMNVDYVDCLQVHASYVSKIPLLETYDAMKKLVEKDKVRFLGASNTSFEELKEIQESFPLTTYEGLYNLDCKIYENMGVVNYCKENNIKFVGYQPIRRNKIAVKNYPFLVEMEERYGKTQNQILVNWIVKEKGLNTLLKSTTIPNIKLNLDCLSFKLEEDDAKTLNNYQNELFNGINIDWKENGGITIDKLSSQFD